MLRTQEYEPFSREIPMKTLAAFLVLAAIGAATQADDWKLVWCDEFDEPGLPIRQVELRRGLHPQQRGQFYTRDRRENARVEERHADHRGDGRSASSSGSVPAARQARGRQGREDAELHLRQPDHAGQGRLDLRPDRGSGQAARPAAAPGRRSGRLGTNIGRSAGPPAARSTSWRTSVSTRTYPRQRPHEDATTT